ncbi:hypothetical protein [Nocardia sp. NPDC057440]|uniref:hypothetical protein n=1 Tax=Nocardia sp. NPDC057440 TaxID=3346134 RepID=UPI003670E30A
MSDLRNAERDVEVIMCTAEGAEHDYRPWINPEAFGPGRSRTYLRCVWCKAVACGNFDQDDPCIEVWHHEPKPHHARSGATWPIGGDRREAV